MVLSVFLAVFYLIVFWQIYLPKSLSQGPLVVYNVSRGSGVKTIAADLEKKGLIKSGLFFRLYVVALSSHSKLQAGSYHLSETMSVAKIVKKLVLGEVVKNKITIIEGWTMEEIAQYLEEKKLFSKEDFLETTKKDWAKDFYFLKDKPKDSGLEGYLFPDTYEVLAAEKPEELLKDALGNFEKKVNNDLIEEIGRQKKSLFDIVIMASILEKEVKLAEDKKIVAGVLLKRFKNSMPLQVDATVNYITGKNDPKISLEDSKIDSPYNTYKYRGLPAGPISNPGMDSILAAIYPTKSDYWYYLSADGNGMTVFSKTLEEHNIAKSKYFIP